MTEMNGVGARLMRLGMFFVVAFLVLSGLLVYWQVVRAPNLVNRPDDPRLYSARLAVHRGAIVDRRGTILEQTTFNSGNPLRTLNDPSLSPLVGYHSQQYDNSGLEAAYNDYLNGNAASQPLDNTIRRILHEPVLGDTLQLTIDDRIQQVADAALGNGPGVALVADPRDGQILAIVSKPTFNANQIDAPGYWASLQTSDGQLLNRALDGRYPPGSVFKTVTLADALTSKAFTLTSVFNGTDASGPLYVGGSLFGADTSNLPPGVSSVTLEDAYKYSDNIVFAKIGLKLGSQALIDGASKFGFGQQIQFDLPTATSTVAANPSTLNAYNIAASAFGQAGVLATPLQMLLVDEAIANGGTIMRPTVVRRVQAPNGEVLVDNQAQVWRQALDPAVAHQVAQAMITAVNGPGASGYAARLPGVVVAGKTGTAQVGGQGVLPHSWFMAFAPADHPRLAVVVLKEHGGEGSAVAAPIARQILAEALRLYR
jgi:peptidoglycan glycosyltransferase